MCDCMYVRTCVFSKIQRTAQECRSQHARIWLQHNILGARMCVRVRACVLSGRAHTHRCLTQEQGVRPDAWVYQGLIQAVADSQSYGAAQPLSSAAPTWYRGAVACTRGRSVAGGEGEAGGTQNEVVFRGKGNDEQREGAVQDELGDWEGNDEQRAPAPPGRRDSASALRCIYVSMGLSIRLSVCISASMHTRAYVYIQAGCGRQRARPEAGPGRRRTGLRARMALCRNLVVA